MCLQLIVHFNQQFCDVQFWVIDNWSLANFRLSETYVSNIFPNKLDFVVHSLCMLIRMNRARRLLCQYRIQGIRDQVNEDVETLCLVIDYIYVQFNSKHLHEIIFNSINQNHLIFENNKIRWFDKIESELLFLFLWCLVFT